MKRTLAAAFAIVALGLAAASAAVLVIRAPAKNSIKEPVWTETAWPFPLDQWGRGRAFACMPADCGVKVDLYIRPKIGFCNCSTGVSDDAELERVGDTVLRSASARPRAMGQPIRVAWMHGLSRSYLDASGEGLLSLAFNDDCDVVVVLAVVGTGDPAAFEKPVIEFLNSGPMVFWAKKELGLEFVRREW